MDKLLNFFQNDQVEDYDIPALDLRLKDVLFRLVSFITTAITGFYCVVYVSEGNNYKTTLYFAIFLILSINLYLYSKHKSLILALRIHIVIVLIIGIDLVFTGGQDGSGLYWLLVFPSIVFFLLSIKEALIWLMLMVSVLIVDFVLIRLGLVSSNFMNSGIIVFFLVAIFIVVVNFFYSYLNGKTIELLENRSKELNEKNFRMELLSSERLLTSERLKLILKNEAEKNAQLVNSKRAMLNILEDIDDEKDNMYEQREKLRIILESIGDGVIVLDRQRRVILVNSKTVEISGYSKRELVGTRFNEVLRFIIGEGVMKNYTKFVDDVYLSGLPSHVDNKAFIIRNDGKKVAVSDSASPIKNSKGKIIGCVVVFRDSTKEREVDRMKSEFVSIASHQLRTPLTGIRWYTELLLDEDASENLTEEQKEFLKSLDANTMRMISLVNDLLNVSRIDSGRKFSIEVLESDLIDVVDLAIEENKVDAEKRNIKLVKSKGFPRKFNLFIDKEKVVQAVHNVINNAVKYSKDNSEVIISFDNTDKKSVILSVQDTGVGIPKAEQNDIFTKFFRAENVSNGTFDGNGLGLYIVKAIVEGHKGSIWFESEEGKGTTFYLKFPCDKTKKMV